MPSRQSRREPAFSALDSASSDSDFSPNDGTFELPRWNSRRDARSSEDEQEEYALRKKWRKKSGSKKPKKTAPHSSHGEKRHLAPHHSDIEAHGSTQQGGTVAPMSPCQSLLFLLMLTFAVAAIVLVIMAFTGDKLPNYAYLGAGIGCAIGFVLSVVFTCHHEKKKDKKQHEEEK
ncbi:hypothetical protein JCM10213_007446 [Rhodosporidiobolus nylandii]